jgi:uncharacterized protein (DUF1015 family)
VPRFEPFRGIRYATDDLSIVTAPPYDVIDAAERAALAALSPHNVVLIDLPVGEDAYRNAAETFRGWISDGTLTVDEPSLYLYRMTFTDEAGAPHHTLGVIGALGLEPPGEGDVLPHEHTTPKAKSDRLQLMRATEANLSPVWGLSLASGLSKLLDTEAADALGAWTDGDGVVHALWRVTDATSAAEIAATVAGAPVVVADGHHRYETSLTLHAERPDLDAGDATMCFVVELVEDQLTVQPIHRLLSGLPAGFDLAAALTPAFDVGGLEGRPDARVVDRLVADGVLALVTSDGLRTLTPRPGAFGDAPDLDSSRLDVALAALPSHDLRYQHGVGHCVDAVTSGDAQAAVLLRPVSVAQIQATAHARDKMPPKSTFFWPKPRTGTVFRSLSTRAL